MNTFSLRSGYFFLFLLLVVLLLLNGCSLEKASQDAAVESETPAGDISDVISEVDNETLENQNLTAKTETACVPQWRCISSTVRSFQESNCTFKAKEKCPISCDFETGGCKTVQCEEGYFCEDPQTRAFRDKYCSWMLEENCELGCKNGACLNQTKVNEEKNKTEIAITAAPKKDPYEGVSWLNYNQKVNLTVGNATPTLSLRIMEAEKVKFMLGEFTSDWVQKGNTTKFFGGAVSITVIEINFQPYEGGVKQVGYKLNRSS